MKEKIYLIPGLMTDERLWQRLIHLLDDKFEFVYIKIPNSEDYDEINEILNEQIEDEKINILGFSLGSYIATYFTIKYPHRVKKLFNLAGTPSKTNSIEIFRRKDRIEAIKKNGFSLLGKRKAISLLENKDDQIVIDLIQKMYEDLGKDVFLAQLASTLNREDLYEKISKLKHPINYYFSKNDRLLNHDSIAKLEQMNLENIVIKSRVGNSHNIPLEDAQNLSLQIIDWMNR
ncbi:alpha/beta fold hydrolase [Arcobacter sp. CECT 8985]|uniref:alpha/beta fold hydrolase n=1 Tax=Arcobacter sp. CECT 8985 TaxID=1935424 RepID=UPI00100A413B|nr:alpha/beta fold hydrolase [Arcobacter sp. CECT 8985]RXJ86368.1 hypothetical protein CRU93_08755 [Arcobacter sp. CECT 8985]